MRKTKIGPTTTILLVVACTAVAAAHGARPVSAERSVAMGASAALDDATDTIRISGAGVHYFSTSILHSRDSTASRVIQRSTDIVRLTGDVNGYILYQPITVIDIASGKLVNTGIQVFSGTIAGSEPILLYDDRFRFEVDLASGAVKGEFFFGRSTDAPNRDSWFECHGVVVGTGTTPEGDGLAEYTGECIRHGASSPG